MAKHPVAWIDADIILHRAVSFCESDFGGDVMTDPKQAIWHFDLLLKSWLTQIGKISDYYLVISNGKNFRHNLYADYKGNRRNIVPHPAFAGLKEAVKQYQATVWEDGIEADDLIGIRTTECSNTIAVSADKDFATIPCSLFIPASHGKDGSWHKFSEDDANRNWLIQSMTGDTTDNYKGIPGIGTVKANKILPTTAPVPHMWAATVAAFHAAKLTQDDALLMARLARILRHGEYDFETKEVKLWTPDAVKTASSLQTTNLDSAMDVLATQPNPTSGVIG
jgi:DNA polymerase-1